MTQYYIIQNDQQAGPYTLEELATMSITPDTMVWSEEMTDWTPAYQVDGLSTLFAPHAQTTPHDSAPTAPQYDGVSQSTPTQQPPMPKDRLDWSLVVTIFGSIICGIVAIVYSSRVLSRYRAGDYDEATRSSRIALIWIILSVCVGIVKWAYIVASLYIMLSLLNFGYPD